MPCNCDYMNPNELEIDSKDTASNIVLVNDLLGEMTESWIIEVTNRFYGDTAKLNRLVITLCALLRDNTNVIDTLDIKNDKHRALMDWYIRHGEADIERVKQEEKAREVQQAKEKALAKLTQQDRRLLGL